MAKKQARVVASISIPTDLWMATTRYADLWDVSAAHVVRRALKAFLGRKEERRPVPPSGPVRRVPHTGRR